MIDLDAIIAEVTGQEKPARKKVVEQAARGRIGPDPPPDVPRQQVEEARWRMALWPKTIRATDGSRIKVWGTAIQIEVKAKGEPRSRFQKVYGSGAQAGAIDHLWSDLCQRTRGLAVEVCSTCDWMVPASGYDEALSELGYSKPSYPDVINSPGWPWHALNYVRPDSVLGKPPRKAWSSWRPVLPRRSAVDLAVQDLMGSRAIDLDAIIAEVTTEQTGETAYGMVYRPPGLGSVPRGFIGVEPHPAFRFGAIVYPGPLHDDEARSYQLVRILSLPEIDALAHQIADQMKYPQETVELARQDERGMRWFSMGVHKKVEESAVYAGDPDAFARLVFAFLSERVP
jgi:hypothetical protein